MEKRFCRRLTVEGAFMPWTLLSGLEAAAAVFLRRLRDFAQRSEPQSVGGAV